MTSIIQTALRQEARLKAIEGGLSDEDREQFLLEVDEAPRYVYPRDYLWDTIHRWEEK